jgi:Protein of unknown function (DUF2975)
MKALGRGSLASWMKRGMDLVWVVLWLGLVAVAGVLAHQVWTNVTGQPGADWRVATPALVGALFAIAAGLVIVDRLKRLLANFSSGEPFQKENAGHVRAIWVSLLAIELSRYVAAAAVAGLVAFSGQPLPDGVKMGFSVSLSAWAAIVALIILAEVFEVGARLREEQDLTI